MIALSSNDRTFLSSPPVNTIDSDFGFDFGTVTKAAMACLKADPNLKKKRFELVPKK